jgi:hypothetical protein
LKRGYKNLLIYFFVFVWINSAFAQEESKTLLNGKKIFEPLHFTGFLIDAGYSNFAMYGQKSDGFSMSLEAEFNEVWCTGLSIDTYSKRSVKFDTPVPVVNPSFSYTFASWVNEFRILRKEIINFSIPLKFGLSSFSYKDKYDDSGNNNDKTILDDAAFSAEAGIHAWINVFKKLSIGGGVSYKWTTDVQQVGGNNDFCGANYHVKVRYIFKNKLKDDKIDGDKKSGSEL